MHGVSRAEGSAIRKPLGVEGARKGQELYQKLNKLLDTDKDIDEMDFLIFPKGHGPNFILECHKLGISIWIIPMLYTYAFQHYSSNINKKEEICESERVKRLLESTRVFLLISPDATTGWHTRKRLIQMEVLSPEEELAFLSVVFTKHPKSGAAWGHRRWVLQQMPLFNKPPTPYAGGYFSKEEFKRELSICEASAASYKNNYYAWTHRIWVLRWENHLNELQKEYKWCNKWNPMHVSENSGFHYRQHLLRKMSMVNGSKYLDVMQSLTPSKSIGKPARIKDSKAGDSWIPKLWQEELDFIKDLIVRYEGFETLWIHLRFVQAHQLRIKCVDRKGGEELWKFLEKFLQNQLKFSRDACGPSGNTSQRQIRFASLYRVRCCVDVELLAKEVTGKVPEVLRKIGLICRKELTKEWPDRASCGGFKI
ncbi:hypothetical protein AAMO2058_001368900 [Amorphochlora amoebiformis]